MKNVLAAFLVIGAAGFGWYGGDAINYAKTELASEVRAVAVAVPKSLAVACLESVSDVAGANRCAYRVKVWGYIDGDREKVAREAMRIVAGKLMPGLIGGAIAEAIINHKP